MQGGGYVWEVGLEPPAPLLCAPPHPCLLCGAQSLPVPHHVTPSLSPDPPCPSQWRTLLWPLLETWGDLQKGHVQHEVGLSPPVSHPACLPLTRNLRTFHRPCPPHSGIDGSRDGAGSDLGRPGPLFVLGWQQVGRTATLPAAPSPLVTASLSLGAQLQPKCM